MKTVCKERILYTLIFAFLLLPFLSTAQVERIPGKRGGEYVAEKPDDPYLPNAYNNKKLSRGYRYDSRTGLKTSAGSIINTHQVNVDSGTQQNIFGDAANEPNIAVNPLNENEIVIGWRQFDNVLSNFRQAGWAYSSDGGQTWTFPGSILPGVFQSDPVLDYDNSGNFYYNSLRSNAMGFPCFVYKSTNAGASWGSGSYIGGGDKQWMTIDRSGGTGEGNIYSSWNSQFSECTPGFYTRSADGGFDFDTCSVIPDDPSWGTLAVGINGELYVSGRSPLTTALKVAKSTDAQDTSQNTTWTTVSNADLGGFLSASSSINPAGLTGQAYIDVDRSNGPGQGNVYLLATVEPYAGNDIGDVMFTKSTDGGVSWNSPPVRINTDTSVTNTQWFGTMSVAPNGRIDVIWLDTRDNPGSDSSALYYSFSVDQGTTWSVNEKLSDSFDPHVGYPNQPKMGDYLDMVSNNTGAHVAWVNTLNGEQDVYYSFITPQVPIGINEVSGNLKVSVLPNPTNGLLEITCRDKKIKVEIFTTLGTKLLTSSEYSTRHLVDLSYQSTGVYFLKLISENGEQTVKKIIRE